MNDCKDNKIGKILWVCWERPDHFPSHDTVILSLLKPSIEVEVRHDYPGVEFIFARERAASVKEKALEIYIKTVAEIGTVARENGLTFRQALQDSEEVSPWWFHPTSRKNCEGDPTLDWIIQTLIITQVAQESQYSNIVIYGGPDEIVQILKSHYFVSAEKCRKSHFLWSYFVRPMLQRVKFFFESMAELIQIKKLGIRAAEQSFDILFSGFWDWSVWRDRSGNLNDRYYQSLPEKLRDQNLKVGWLAWFHHTMNPNEKKRTIAEAAAPLKNLPEIIIAQNFLYFRDIFVSIMNFRPFFVYLNFLNMRGFRKVFKAGRLDFFPLFKEFLMAGFLDSTIPRYSLIYLAHKRASQRYKPTSVVSFLDFFLHARAVNAGVKQGSRKTILYDIQHASYSREKTFGVLDPVLEYKGCPEGNSIPRPEYICVMGELGRDIFLEGGFDPSQILMTGSTRYDSAAMVNVNNLPKPNLGKRVLIVTTLQKRGLEFEMIDAVERAFRDFPEVQLSLRSHPFFKIAAMPEFMPYKDRIKSTSGKTLDEDLANADIVIFSYSTVAEESFIQGIPVWQWTSAGYNASVFRDIPVIPTFSSVDELVRLYTDFNKDMNKYIPTTQQRRLVKQKCFYGDENNLPSDNVARILMRDFTRAEDLQPQNIARRPVNVEV